MANLDRTLSSLKRAGAAQRDAGLPFAVGGGPAISAYGGDPGDQDVDLMVRARDADRAQQVLAETGMRPENPPEEWLLKVHDRDVKVDWAQLRVRTAESRFARTFLDLAERIDIAPVARTAR